MTEIQGVDYNAYIEDEDEGVGIEVAWTNKAGETSVDHFSFGPFESDRILVANYYELCRLIEQLGIDHEQTLNLRPKIRETPDGGVIETTK